MKRRVTWFATATGPSAQPTPIAFGQWGSAIIRLRRAHHGRTATSNASSARFGAKASTTSSSAAKRTILLTCTSLLSSHRRVLSREQVAAAGLSQHLSKERLANLGGHLKLGLDAAQRHINHRAN